MEDDKLLINLKIGSPPIALLISRKDEEMYRKAERIFVANLDEYLQIYPQKSREEILTLVAFRIATNAVRQDLREDIAPLAEKIQSLNDELKVLLTEE